MRKLKMIAKLLQYIALLGLLSLSLPSYADDEDSGLEDNMTFHVYDDVDLVSTLKFEYGKPRIIIKTVYPQLASETEHAGINGFNEEALQIVKEEIASFREKVKEQKPFQQKLPKDKITNNLYIDYNTSYVKSKKNHIISIRFSIQGIIAGMAHPFHTHRVLNYNLDLSHKIELSELFKTDSTYLDIISSYTNTVLSKHLQDSQLVAAGTAPRLENFDDWNIKTTGLFFTFDDGKVAPRVYGTQTVLVPYSALEEVTSPDSPLLDCMDHQQRCTNTTLLTGGFIDEA